MSSGASAAVAGRAGYPRPDRDRSERWQSLDGPWRLQWEDGEGEILVPFAWETAASGIERPWLGSATYRRTVTVPADWAGTRVFLMFGAVHHHARVLVDGVQVGEHTGGYVSFELEVTDVVVPGGEHRLEVQVEAPTDKRHIPHGKQRSVPLDDFDSCSFAPTSGIWQSVWLEARGRTYVEHVGLRGDSLTGFDVTGRLGGDAPGLATVTLTADSGESVTVRSDAAGTFAARLDVADPHLWSPETPHLYRVEATVVTGDGTDRVVVTGGLRRFEARGEHLLLNGVRISLRGVLDQGYWPDSGLTAPDEDALLRDLDLARELGFTLVRKHLKLEDPRWLHHADEIGMLVWEEPPAPSRFGPGTAAAFDAQLAPMVERDSNHPSIVVWGLWNEEWGLDWDIPGNPACAAAAAASYDTLRALDPTRPIIENSGWNHVRTDIVDWHYYEPDPATFARVTAGIADGSVDAVPSALRPDFVVAKSLYASPDVPRTGLPLMNSEYGQGLTSLERAWYCRWQTQELRRHDRSVGYVYTELCDIEHETAGLLDARRRPKPWGGLVPSDVHAETVLVLDVVPAQPGVDVPLPTGTLTVPVHVSHHGRDPLVVRLRAAWQSLGRAVDGTPPAALVEVGPVEVEPFVLTATLDVVVPPPVGLDVARLVVWAVDEHGATVARTFLDAGPLLLPDANAARTVPAGPAGS